MKQSLWFKKGIGITSIVIIAVTVLSWIVMKLWNNVLVDVVNVTTVTFWQAAGILLLSKILFSGFKGKRHGNGFYFKRKWLNASPEERDAMINEWKSRCSTMHAKKNIESNDTNSSTV